MAASLSPWKRMSKRKSKSNIQSCVPGSGRAKGKTNQIYKVVSLGADEKNQKQSKHTSCFPRSGQAKGKANQTYKVVSLGADKQNQIKHTKHSKHQTISPSV